MLNRITRLFRNKAVRFLLAFALVLVGTQAMLTTWDSIYIQ